MPKNDGKGPNRTTPTKDGATPRYKGQAKAKPTEPVQWSLVNPNLIASVVDSVTHVGDAVIFSRTSDGGAYSLTILTGSERYKQYATTVEECEAVLASIKADLDAEIFK